MRRLIVPIASLTVAAASACMTHGDALSSTSRSVKQDVTIGNDLDVLFVIDDSPSTSDKQTLFAQNFPQLVTALDAFPGGRPNLHIGVVSSTVDLGTDQFGGCPSPDPKENGLLQNTMRSTGCNAPSDLYISDIQPPGGGPRVVNYAGGDLAATFSCIAQIGSTGCGFEHQLEGMKRALDGSRPENAGFLRPTASLAVVILTDEDDCSVQDPTLFDLPAAQAGPGDFRCQPLFAYQCDQPISATTTGTYTNCGVLDGSYLHDPLSYATFLTNLKGDPSRVMTALIAGDPQTTIMTGAFFQSLALMPSCTATINGNTVYGRPGIRLAQFLSAFGDQGVFTSVCDSSYSPPTSHEVDYSHAMASIGGLIASAITPCLRGQIDSTDTDPVNPGLQIDCTVADVTTWGPIRQVGPALPICAMTDASTPDPSGARPCWWLESRPDLCTTNAGLELHVERAETLIGNTTVEVECPTSAT